MQASEMDCTYKQPAICTLLVYLYPMGDNEIMEYLRERSTYPRIDAAMILKQHIRVAFVCDNCMAICTPNMVVCAGCLHVIKHSQLWGVRGNKYGVALLRIAEYLLDSDNGALLVCPDPQHYKSVQNMSFIFYETL